MSRLWRTARALAKWLAAGLALSVISLGSIGCTPAGGDPGGRRLKELSDDPVFAELPEGTQVIKIERMAANYTRPAFQTHGWNGPYVTIQFRSSAPIADIFAFYAPRADAAGWLDTGRKNVQGFSNLWRKTYPDGAPADFHLLFIDAGKTYHLSGSIAPILPRWNFDWSIW